MLRGQDWEPHRDVAVARSEERPLLLAVEEEIGEPTRVDVFGEE
jgi:hypothetical protein